MRECLLLEKILKAVRKTSLFLVLIMFGVAPAFTSCKSLAKSAVRHWTNKQRKEFIEKCKVGAVEKFNEKTNDYCTCLADVAEEKYPKAEEALSLEFVQMLKLSKDCLSEHAK